MEIVSMQNASAAAQHITPRDYSEGRKEILVGWIDFAGKVLGLLIQSSVTDLSRHNITDFICSHIKVSNEL